MKKLVLGTVALTLVCGINLYAKPSLDLMKNKGLQPLTADQVKSVISDKTLNGNHYRGWKIELKNDADGTFALDNKTKSKYISGTWRMDGNNYCNKSYRKDMRKGKEGCFSVYNDGIEYHFFKTSNGDIAFSIK